MTREEWKERLPLIQAFIGGAEIQSNQYGEWVEVSEPTLTRGIDEYRIKPEPKLRAWKRGEIPVGHMLRHKQDHFQLSIVLGVKTDCDADFVTTTIGGAIYNMVCPVLLDCYEHSTDGGKTWQPCGILEES